MKSCHILRKFRITIMPIVVVLALCLQGFHVSAASANSIVGISIPSQSPSPGSEFTLSVTVQPTSAVAGAQVNLSFNPALVTVKTIIEGNLLKQNGDSTYFSPGRIDNTAGTIIGIAGTITNPGKAVSAEGTLAVITMVAGSTDANCPINLSKVILGDVNAQSVPVSSVNSNITIGTGTNQPPILGLIGNKTINAGSLLTFIVSGIDPENDPLTYSASNLPAGAIFNPSSGTFTWTPTSSQVATHSNVTFKVTDGSLNATENITIIVAQAAPPSGGGGFTGGPVSGGGPIPPGPLPPATTTVAPDTNTGIIKTPIQVGSEDGLATVMIDSGTKGLTKDGKGITTIAMFYVPEPPVLPEQTFGIGKTYDIEPDGATFDHPIKLIFTLDPVLIPKGIDENSILVATFDTLSGKWIDLPSTINSESHTVTAEANHFSLYCVLTHTQPPAVAGNDVAVPAVPESTQSAVNVKKIQVSAPEVFIGETVTITALVTNNVNTSSIDDIILKINGDIEGQRKVIVGAGLEETIVFDIIKNEPGEYTADINGVGLTFVVKPPVPITQSSPINSNAADPNGLPTPPATTMKSFSLSLLSQLIGLAFLFICVTLITIAVRRKQLLRRVQYQ